MANLVDQIQGDRRTGNLEFFIEERNPEYIISCMPVTPGILNPFGIVQAGAMLWLADVTASELAVGGQIIGDDGRGFPLTIDVHTAIVSNQREGEIRAEARFVRRGRNVVVISTRVTGDCDKLLAEVTTTHIKAMRIRGLDKKEC